MHVYILFLAVGARFGEDAAGQESYDLERSTWANTPQGSSQQTQSGTKNIT